MSTISKECGGDDEWFSPAIKNLSKKLDKEFNVKELRKISKRYGLKIKQKGGKYFKKNEICKKLAKTLRK